MVPEQLLKQLFTRACQSADPQCCLPPYLRNIDHQSIVLLALGKSATGMAGIASQYFGDKIRASLAVTAYGHAEDCAPVAVIESSHPVPDDNSMRAGQALLQLASSATADDLVLVLISGGGSSLAVVPVDGLCLQDKQKMNRQLLKSGANIHLMNSLRKHLSHLKGGRLAIAAQPAQVCTLAISDVPADSPESIASGPTLPDPTTCSDCLAVIQEYGIELPLSIVRRLQDGCIETPKPGDAAFTSNEFHVIASPQQSLDVVGSFADGLGLQVINLGADIYQDVSEIAQLHAYHIAKASKGSLILSGGEASVQIKGTGQGGRNGQFLLSLACELDQAAREYQWEKEKKIWAIACDTDGIDGTGDNAGCLLTPDSMTAAKRMNLDPYAMLNNNDSYRFFEALDNLIITGPTGTNVNDFRAVLVV